MSSPSTDRMGQGSGPMLRMSSPSVIAVAVVLLAAAITVALLLIPRGTPPVGSGSPSAEPTAAVTATPSATPTSEPSTTPTPAITPPPTPSAPATWTGLAWSDPATPAFEVHLYDLELWDGRYVAVGEVGGRDGQGDAAFLTSPDGLDWTVTHRVSPGFGRIPRHLVALGDELLAFGVPDTDALPLGAAHGHLVWSSTDGTTWTLVESPTWSAAWAGRQIGPMPAGWEATHSDIETALVDVASGPAGLVAIGNSFGVLGMDPVVLHSTDGRAWSIVSLPDSPSAMLASVEAFGDGFVMVGAVGVGPEVATSVAAGWFSSDGETWTRAIVEGRPALPGGGEFGQLAAGVDGLVGCHESRAITVGGPRDGPAWVSSNGRTWHMEPDPDSSRACGWMAGNGTWMVALAPVPDPGTGRPWSGVSEAYISIDGLTWEPMTVSTTLTDLPEAFWVMPDGVVYAGRQSFWFGTAITP